MSVILIVSIMIRLIAMGWSIIILKRLRDWRFGFLTLLFGLMAIRQTFTLLTEKESWVISFTTHTIELPGLLVSIMVFLAIFFLEKIISERQRAEQVLQESETFFSGTLNDMLTFVAILEPDGKVVFVNNTPLDVAGITLNDVKGIMFYDAFWWQYSEEARQQIKEDIEFCATGETLVHEIEIQNAGGKLIWIEYSMHPIYNENGEIKYLVPEGRDITEFKQAEVVLKKSEARLSDAQKIAHLGYWDWNIVTNDLYWSDEIYRIFGLESQEFGATYEAFLDTLHPEDKDFVQQSVNKALNEDKPYSIDHRIVLPSGEIRTVHEQAEVTFESPDKPIRMMGTIQDITERKRAEKHIQHLQSVLMAIRNVNQLIVWEKNPQKLLQNACEILNQTRDYKLVWIGLIQEGSKEVFPAAQVGDETDYLKSIKITWDDSDTGKGPTGTAIHTKKPVVMQDIARDPRYEPWRKEAMKRDYVSSAAVPLVHKNRVLGALNVYASIPQAFDEEETDLLIEVSRDIAFALHSIELEEKHRRVEAERQKTELHLGTILNSAADAIITVDINQRILNFNKGAEKIFGYRSEEILGKSLDILIPSHLAKVHRQHVRDFTSGPETTHHMGELSQEVLGRRKDGREFPADASISRLILNTETTFTIILRDITELKQAEEAVQKAYDELEAKVAERTRELTQANIQLQEVDRLKSEFLATMSHELRTPLNSIIGFTGIIMKGMAGEINKEQKKQLSMVNDSAKHLLSLINDILDLSRIEAGKMELSMEKIKLKSVISEVAQILSPSISQKGLKLLVEIPEKTPEFYSNRKKVLQILLNLANNAVKFTEKGKIKIEAKLENDNLQVSVSDTGIGIKKEDLNYLFEAFRQVDGTARRRYQGAGLGLYLCKKLVTLLGGNIWAESEYGKGSKFTFTLPLQLEEGK